MLEKKWYIVHTKVLYEDRVKKGIEKEIDRLSLEDRIFNVVVPTEDVIEIKKNKQVIRKRKFFPGYVLVQMILTDDLYWIIKNVTGVSSFLGGSSPISMPDEEADALINKINDSSSDKPRPLISFRLNENVRIMDGPFINFIGSINEINEEKAKLTVMVTIFGRATPVVVDFLHVEKI